MSASYKPALLKALVRVSRRSEELDVTLEHLGDEFARMYWNQTVIYHLRQASALTKESEVIKVIRRAAQEHRARFFQELPAAGRTDICRRMARVLTINVLDAFHSSKPAEMAPLYSWERKDREIHLTEQSHAFLRRHAGPLEIIANYYWAEFLESRNRLAPKIIQKVERDGPPRESLRPFFQLLIEEDGACFYCGTGIEGEEQFAVDHVIPRSFLLEDPLWDLVLACRRCNSQKSDWLPEAHFVERLVKKNALRMKAAVGRHASLLAEAGDVVRLYEAAISLEWPRFWAPR